MAFLGGPECSTAANPLAQFSKHTSEDKSLQRDRLAGRAPRFEGFRDARPMEFRDRGMDDFASRSGVDSPLSAQPFAMNDMRKELERMSTPTPRTMNSSWSSEFESAKPGILDPQRGSMRMNGARNGFDAGDFKRFQAQQQQHHGPQQSQMGASQNMLNGNMYNSYQRPMGMGYSSRFGMGGMNGMYGGQTTMQPMAQSSKGKERMVELDDKNWEQEFAQIDQRGLEDTDQEADARLEAELNQADRQLGDEFTLDPTLGFDADEDLMSSFNPWNGFDQSSLRDPLMGQYMFEQENPFEKVNNPFEEGMKIMEEAGNLSLAALAFEAAVQQEPSHVQAWVMLGNAQAQNEKETAAIRALEEAKKLDPENLQALMGLAISYTNESYDATAYRTLERWLSIKYPQILNPDAVSSAADIGFTDRAKLHERVTDLFIQAAQLSPDGEHMDPDVQVGLGVLFYGDENYDKAVDCFTAALASTETGTSNERSQVHLLWNRLGATLANSGRSEEAIAAYEKALTLNPNFVRARYNLGVSCINVGCYEEAAQHLLGALNMHRVVEREGRERVQEVVGDDLTKQQIEALLTHNESTNLYETLRRVFVQMERKDLADKVVPGMDLAAFRKEFEF